MVQYFFFSPLFGSLLLHMVGDNKDECDRVPCPQGKNQRVIENVKDSSSNHEEI